MVTLITSEMVDSQEIEVLDPEYTRLVNRGGEVLRVYYSGLGDFSQADFEKIPAFGMWARRGKSAEQLLEDVSGRWGGED